MKIRIEPADYRYRDHQWMAIEGDYDLGKPIGSGRTPLEALDDLLWHLDLDALPADVVVELQQ
jgi:hypothetical protein